MKIRPIHIAKTGAAAMANATAGRHTDFDSKAEIEKKSARASAKAMIDEGVEEWLELRLAAKGE